MAALGVPTEMKLNNGAHSPFQVYLFCFTALIGLVITIPQTIIYGSGAEFHYKFLISMPVDPRAARISDTIIFTMAALCFGTGIILNLIVCVSNVRENLRNAKAGGAEISAVWWEVISPAFRVVALSVTLVGTNAVFMLTIWTSQDKNLRALAYFVNSTGLSLLLPIAIIAVSPSLKDYLYKEMEKMAILSVFRKILEQKNRVEPLGCESSTTAAQLA